MTATFEQIRENFVKKIIKGDYLSNRVGSAPTIYGSMMDRGENSEPRIPRFVETYRTGGEKDYVVIEALSEWDVEGGVVNLETLLAQYPELQKDINYADYLAEMFENELKKVHSERNKVTRERIEQRLSELIDRYKKIQAETNNFHYEADKGYEEYLKKEKETGRPSEGGRN
jgi:hypothetical protein